MKTLIIIRGIPGSGKTSIAHRIVDSMCFRSDCGDEVADFVWCEADQFFMEHGEYHYVAHLVPTAHEWCQRKVHAAMKRGTATVIVSNTGTVRSRLQVYHDLAREFGYQVQQIVVFGNFGTVHKVPEDSMEKFREQLRSSLIQELKAKEIP
jgi:tRNA uridine 5-carbamoylmethylation protein Kti12